MYSKHFVANYINVSVDFFSSRPSTINLQSTYIFLFPEPYQAWGKNCMLKTSSWSAQTPRPKARLKSLVPPWSDGSKLRPDRV